MNPSHRNPRRWRDYTGRVRVVEGEHSSRRDRIGFNLIIDGEWVDTFDSLDEAVAAATRCPASPTFDPTVHKGVIVDGWSPGGKFIVSGLHRVEEA